MRLQQVKRQGKTFYYIDYIIVLAITDWGWMGIESDFLLQLTSYFPVITATIRISSLKISIVFKASIKTRWKPTVNAFNYWSWKWNNWNMVTFLCHGNENIKVLYYKYFFCISFISQTYCLFALHGSNNIQPPLSSLPSLHACSP